MMVAGDKEPKVLYVTFAPMPAAAGLSAWAMESLKKISRHFSTDCLCIKSEPQAHIERMHRARLLRVPVGEDSLRHRIRAFQRALRRQLESEDYRLCHFTTMWAAEALMNQKKRFGCKLIFELHSLPSVDLKYTHPEEVEDLDKEFGLRRLEDRCFAQADTIIVGSELLRNQLLYRGVARERISLLRPAVDTSRFDQIDTPRQAGTILYLGSLAPWQGIPFLLKAVAQLPYGMPVRIKLATTADEHLRSALKGRIQMLGLGRKVQFIGPHAPDQLEKLVASADVCVAPLIDHEHNELAASTPLKILTYMAGRRAVVASRQAAVSELIQHGVHGLLHTPGDTHGLVESLKKLMFDRELATRLGNQARTHLDTSLGLKNALAHLLELTQRTLGIAPSDHPAAWLDASDVATLPGIREGNATLGFGEPDTTPQRPLPNRKEPGQQAVNEEATTDPGIPRHLDPATEDTAPVPGAPASARAKPEPAIVFEAVPIDADGSQHSIEGWQVIHLSRICMPLPATEALSQQPTSQPVPLISEEQLKRIREDTSWGNCPKSSNGVTNKQND